MKKRKKFRNVRPNTSSTKFIFLISFCLGQLYWLIRWLQWFSQLISGGDWSLVTLWALDGSPDAFPFPPTLGARKQISWLESITLANWPSSSALIFFVQLFALAEIGWKSGRSSGSDSASKWHDYSRIRWQNHQRRFKCCGVCVCVCVFWLRDPLRVSRSWLWASRILEDGMGFFVIAGVQFWIASLMGTRPRGRTQHSTGSGIRFWRHSQVGEPTDAAVEQENRRLHPRR